MLLKVFLTCVLNFWQYFEKPTHQKCQISETKFEKMKMERTRIGQKRLELNPQLFQEFMVKITQNRNNFTGFSIVSSSDSIFIKTTLGEEIQLFDQILGFDHSHNKEEKIQQIAKKYDLDLNQIIYITDTATDILELEGVLPKVNIFGVDWGYQGATKLAEFLSENQLLWNFEDFERLILILKN